MFFVMVTVRSVGLVIVFGRITDFFSCEARVRVREYSSSTFRPPLEERQLRAQRYRFLSRFDRFSEKFVEKTIVRSIPGSLS